MFSSFFIARWVHLVAAATWLGGIITLAVLVAAMRRANVERGVLVIAARAFARLSWVALAVAIVSGLAQVHLLRVPWSMPALHLKIGLVGAVTVVAIVHARFARAAKPAWRIALEIALLGLSLAIYAAAIRL